MCVFAFKMFVDNLWQVCYTVHMCFILDQIYGIYGK